MAWWKIDKPISEQNHSPKSFSNEQYLSSLTLSLLQLRYILVHLLSVEVAVCFESPWRLYQRLKFTACRVCSFTINYRVSNRPIIQRNFEKLFGWEIKAGYLLSSLAWARAPAEPMNNSTFCRRRVLGRLRSQTERRERQPASSIASGRRIDAETSEDVQRAARFSAIDDVVDTVEETGWQKENDSHLIGSSNSRLSIKICEMHALCKFYDSVWYYYHHNN